jgi:energy-coupling factor transport system permease protein
VLFTAGPLIVTEEGLTDASVKTLRILCMITGARLLTATTPVESLVRAFGWFLKPLQHAGIPVNDFVSTMGLTLQSLPALRDQMINNGREIMKRDNVSGFWNRVRVIAGLLMPLFVQSLQTPERIFRNTKK